MIGASIRTLIKNSKDEIPWVERLLPQEALYSDTREHVKNFKRYLEDYKMQKKQVMNSEALYIDSHFESGNIEKVLKD